MGESPTRDKPYTGEALQVLQLWKDLHLLLGFFPHGNDPNYTVRVETVETVLTTAVPSPTL